MTIETLPILGVREAAERLNIKPGTLNSYTERYHIPHKLLQCGKIYLVADIDAFQAGRQSRLKHRRNTGSTMK